MTTTSYRYIELDQQGTAWIGGTSTKVVEIVAEMLAYDWDPAQLHAQHPHLSLAQVHSALAYYYDHQQDLDAELERRLAQVDQILARVGESDIRRRLQAARRSR